MLRDMLRGGRPGLVFLKRLVVVAMDDDETLSLLFIGTAHFRG